MAISITRASATNIANRPTNTCLLAFHIISCTIQSFKSEIHSGDLRPTVGKGEVHKGLWKIRNYLINI